MLRQVLFSNIGSCAFQMVLIEPFSGLPRADGWYSPGMNFWDLWSSNEIVATISRTASGWSGSYFGPCDGQHLDDFKEFRGPFENPRDLMAQIEEYATAPNTDRQCESTIQRSVTASDLA